MNNILILIITAVSLSALLATCVWLAKRNSGALTYLANGISDGTHAAAVTLLSDAAISTRFLLVRIGSDAAHVALCGVGDIALGVATDETAAAEEPVNVQLLGIGESTCLGVASAAIAAGALVVAAASGKLRTLPTATGSYHIIGRALVAAGADNDRFEFIPTFPVLRVVA
jgi:hypothetical protein